jgi:hypothetical protein
MYFCLTLCPLSAAKMYSSEGIVAERGKMI